jgi:hypothetical protein
MKQAAERFMSRRPSTAKQLRQLGDVDGDAPSASDCLHAAKKC